MAPTDAATEHEDAEHAPAEVDADGRPEGPVQQAVEKSKDKNRQRLGLLLGAIGIVVAIVLARRHAANAAAAASAAAPATSGVPGTIGSDPTAGAGVGGSGIDPSYLSNLQGELGGLSTGQGQQQDAITALAQQLGLMSASIDTLTAAEQQAHLPVAGAGGPGGTGPLPGSNPSAPGSGTATPPSTTQSFVNGVYAWLHRGTGYTGPAYSQAQITAATADVKAGKATLPTGFTAPAGYVLDPSTHLLHPIPGYKGPATTTNGAGGVVKAPAPAKK